MEVNHSLEVAHLLDVVHGDELAVHLNALLGEFGSNGSCIHRAIELAGGTHLSLNLKSNIFKGLATLFGGSLEGSQLVGLLLQVLSKHFLVACRGDDSLALGDEIVTTVAALDIHNIVLVSKTDDIFFQY